MHTRSILILAGFTVAFTASAASAQGLFENAFETVDEARQRHSAERYQQDQIRILRGEPLGGYKDSFGDTSPYGTARPGVTTPQTSGSRDTWNSQGSGGFSAY